MIKLICNDILHYWTDCWKYAVIFEIFFLICRLTVYAVKGYFDTNQIAKKHWMMCKEMLAFSCLGMYIVYFLYIVFGIRYIGSRREVSFALIERNPYELRFVYENILFYIPYGILLPMCFVKFQRIKYLFIILLSTSLYVEVMQYIFACGKSELNDILMNVLGGILGWLLYSFFHCFIFKPNKCLYIKNHTL